MLRQCDAVCVCMISALNFAERYALRQTGRRFAYLLRHLNEQFRTEYERQLQQVFGVEGLLDRLKPANRKIYGGFTVAVLLDLLPLPFPDLDIGGIFENPDFFLETLPDPSVHISHKPITRPAVLSAKPKERDYPQTCFHAFLNAFTSVAYSMFPIKFARKLQVKSNATIDYNLISEYKSVDEFVRNVADFRFSAVVYDGVDLRVLDWESIWLRQCETRISNIAWRPAYPCGAESNPGFEENPLQYSLHSLTSMLIRSHARRAKYELRGHFKITILDEQEIIDTIYPPPMPWPISTDAFAAYLNTFCHSPQFYLSRSPWTGSLYLSPNMTSFPWYQEKPQLDLHWHLPLCLKRRPQEDHKKQRQQEAEEIKEIEEDYDCADPESLLIKSKSQSRARKQTARKKKKNKEKEKGGKKTEKKLQQL